MYENQKLLKPQVQTIRNTINTSSTKQTILINHRRNHSDWHRIDIKPKKENKETIKNHEKTEKIVKITSEKNEQEVSTLLSQNYNIKLLRERNEEAYYRENETFIKKKLTDFDFMQMNFTVYFYQIKEFKL